MRRNQLLTFFLAAILIPLAAQAVVMETVPVGNPGNGPDSGTRIGDVAYNYRIGKYEVTNAQYTEFLNSVDPTGANQFGLYSFSMTLDPLGGITINNGAQDGSKYSVK